MRKLKPAAVIAAAAVIGLVVSGCYAFSGLTTSKIRLNPGQTSTINVKSYARSGNQDRDVFFLLINLPDNDTPGDITDDPLLVKNGRFDTSEIVYNRPKRLRPNAAIRDELVTDGACGQFNFADAPHSRWVVLATSGRVNQLGPNKQVNSRYVLKQVDLNDTINPLGMITAVGFWDDDGDGNPESNVLGELGCSGGALHNINAKTPPSVRAAQGTTKRDVIEAYAD